MLHAKNTNDIVERLKVLQKRSRFLKFSEISRRYFRECTKRNFKFTLYIGNFTFDKHVHVVYVGDTSNCRFLYISFCELRQLSLYLSSRISEQVLAFVVCMYFAC